MLPSPETTLASALEVDQLTVATPGLAHGVRRRSGAIDLWRQRRGRTELVRRGLLGGAIRTVRLGWRAPCLRFWCRAHGRRLAFRHARPHCRSGLSFRARAEPRRRQLTGLAHQLGQEPSYDHGLAGRLISVRGGTDSYKSDLLRGDGWSITRIAYDNLEVGLGGTRRLAKPDDLRMFTDFSAYEAYLLEALIAIRDNGMDPRRRVRYRITSTCSSGYNSSACTALAAALGAREALTIVSARGGGYNSGRASSGSSALTPSKSSARAGPEIWLSRSRVHRYWYGWGRVPIRRLRSLSASHHPAHRLRRRTTVGLHGTSISERAPDRRASRCQPAEFSSRRLRPLACCVVGL